MTKISDQSYEAHVRLWTHMLRTLLGWTDAQVTHWAAHFKDGIADENSWFYHEPPEFYVARVLMPQHLAKKTGVAKYYNLECDIQGVLQRVLENSRTVEEIDWQPAKANIDALLAEYGESLTRVAKEKADWYRD